MSSPAREAIEALIFAYAERLDAGDLAGVGALFAHATYRSEHGGRYQGSAEVADRLNGLVRLYDGTPRTRHVTTNVVVEVDEASASARARAYFTVFQATDDLPLQAIAAGRYLDRFACVAGVWRFADRLICVDLVGELSRHLRRAEA